MLCLTCGMYTVCGCTLLFRAHTGIKESSLYKPAGTQGRVQQHAPSGRQSYHFTSLSHLLLWTKQNPQCSQRKQWQSPLWLIPGSDMWGSSLEFKSKTNWNNLACCTLKFFCELCFSSMGQPPVVNLWDDNETWRQRLFCSLMFFHCKQEIKEETLKRMSEQEACSQIAYLTTFSFNSNNIL